MIQALLKQLLGIFQNTMYPLLHLITSNLHQKLLVLYLNLGFYLTIALIVQQELFVVETQMLRKQLVLATKQINAVT